MPLLKRIVCATDFSPSSERALATAAAWSRALETPLTVLTVVDTLAHRVPSKNLPFTAPPSPADVKELEKAADAHLQTWVDEQLSALQPTSSVIAHDDVAEGICEGLTGLDLLMVGTRGKSGLERLMLGSVAERTLRHAPCPVLVVRGGRALPRRALICTDLTETATPALSLGGRVCRAFDAEGTVLHVRSKPGPALERELMVRTETDADSIENALTEELERLHAQHLPGPVNTAFDEGASIAEAIADHAAQHDTDLITVATRAPSGLSRWLIGSVAEQVARYAPCSVLVARAPST